MAPLGAVIRCSASIEAEASTTKTIRLPTLRSRTFWCRSCCSSRIRSPSSLPRLTWCGAAARTRVGHLLLHLGPDIPAAAVSRLAGGSLPRLLARRALARELDLANREE